MSQTVQLLEFTQVSKAKKIDEDAGVLYGLKILGNVSANGRKYPAATIERAAQLYEGRPSNANHLRKGGEDVDVNNRLGVWVKAYPENGELYGDFAYFKSHPMAARLIEAAKRPELNRAFGFSHNATGREKHEAGETIIEAIESVHSIDLVADPATVSGLYESRSTMKKKVKLKDLIEALKTKRPGYAKGLREEAEAGILSPDYEMDMPSDEPAADEEIDHEQAILDAAKAVLDDTGLDTGEKLAKIKKLLGIIDAGEEEEEETPGDETETEESKRLKLENLGLRLLMESGVKPTKVISRALAGCTTEREVRECVAEAKESLGGTGKTGGAKSGGGDTSAQQRFQESQQQQQQGGPLKFEGEKAQEQRLAHLRGRR